MMKHPQEAIERAKAVRPYVLLCGRKSEYGRYYQTIVVQPYAVKLYGIDVLKQTLHLCVDGCPFGGSTEYLTTNYENESLFRCQIFTD